MTASGCILLLLFWLLAAGSGLMAAVTGNYAYAAGGLAALWFGWFFRSWVDRAVNARRKVYDRWQAQGYERAGREEHAAATAYYRGKINYPTLLYRLKKAAAYAPPGYRTLYSMLREEDAAAGYPRLLEPRGYRGKANRTRERTV